MRPPQKSPHLQLMLTSRLFHVSPFPPWWADFALLVLRSARPRCGASASSPALPATSGAAPDQIGPGSHAPAGHGHTCVPGIPPFGRVLWIVSFWYVLWCFLWNFCQEALTWCFLGDKKLMVIRPIRPLKSELVSCGGIHGHILQLLNETAVHPSSEFQNCVIVE